LKPPRRCEEADGKMQSTTKALDSGRMHIVHCARVVEDVRSVVGILEESSGLPVDVEKVGTLTDCLEYVRDNSVDAVVVDLNGLGPGDRERLRVLLGNGGRRPSGSPPFILLTGPVKEAREGSREEPPFRTMIAKNADGILIIDEQGNILFSNPAAEALFGASAEKLLGRHIGCPLTTCESTEIELLREDGTKRTAEMRAVETKWKGRKARLATLRDITERKLMEERLLDTKRDLEQTVENCKLGQQKLLEQQKMNLEDERLKVMLQMAGATAHELNQPLTVLLGNLELIHLRCNPPPEMVEYLSEIDNAAKRISHIVSKARDLPHREPKPSAEVNCAINFDRTVRILSIEDEEVDYETLSACLRGVENLQLKRAKTLSEASELLRKESFDVALLDYMLPDGNGVDFMRMLKGLDTEIPVIMITGQGSETLASTCIQEGAFDYFPKNMINGKSLSRSIYNTIEKSRLKNEIKRAQQKLAEMATMDGLTGLYNRRYFLESLQKEMGRADRMNSELALYMFDIDGFKSVNDLYGHQTGDAVLAGLGRLLRETIRLIDVPSRYGGEEFAVLLPSTKLREAQTACERLRRAVTAHPFTFNEVSIRITVSIGVVSYWPNSGYAASQLIEAADKALYRAKNDGKNRVVSAL
jgi:two-component system cell cycle response regulator